MIAFEIISYLPETKRGFKLKVPLVEIVNSILYKLKTGVQWQLLPVGVYLSDQILHYKQYLIIIANGVKKMLGCHVGYNSYQSINLN